MGLLLAGLGGAGEAATRAAGSYQNYLEHSQLQSEMADIQKLRDERMNEFTAGENTKSRDQAERMQGAGFEHAEKLQQQLKDFQALEHGMDREQRLQLHEQTMAQLKSQFKNQGLALQADKDGYLGVADLKTNSFKLLAGADGQPVKGQKSEDSIKLIEAIGHSMKAFDPLDPSTKDIRDRLGNALLTALAGKTGAVAAPAAPGNRPSLDSFAKGGKGGAKEPAGSGLLASTAPEGSAREQDPVQAAQLRREAEMRTEYEKEQEAKRKKGEEYQQGFRDNIDRTNLRSGM